MNKRNDIKELNEKLKNHEKRLESIEEKIFESKEINIPYKDTGIDQKLEKFALDAKINKDDLRYIFDIEENNFKLIANIEEEQEPEKQFRATILILTANHYLFNNDEIKSSDLKIHLEWKKISSNNLSRTLSKYKQLLVSKGKPKSKEYMYKITYPGIKEGLKIIKELASS